MFCRGKTDEVGFSRWWYCQDSAGIRFRLQRPNVESDDVQFRANVTELFGAKWAESRDSRPEVKSTRWSVRLSDREDSFESHFMVLHLEFRQFLCSTN